LIPGVGYGRIANVFLQHGLAATGIEISGYAISMAKNEYKLIKSANNLFVVVKPIKAKRLHDI
jgi:hypothetical protein